MLDAGCWMLDVGQIYDHNEFGIWGFGFKSVMPLDPRLLGDRFAGDRYG
jgi:hypothetical protein